LLIADSIGYGIAQFTARAVLGRIAQLRGEYEAAIGYFRRAVEVATAVGIPMFSVMALSSLGAVYLDVSDHYLDEVTELHMQTVQLLQTPVGGAAGAWAWADLGFCVLSRGDLEHSDELFQNGLNKPSIFKVIEKPRHLIGSALVALGRDQLDEAARYIAEAYAYVEQQEMQHLHPLIHLVRGQVQVAQGNSEAALSSFAESESLAQNMKLLPTVWQAQTRTAQVLTTLGRTDEANAKQRQAQEITQQIAALFQDEKLRELYLESVKKKLAMPDLIFGV
jgi:ATP/maltotriose-dependent transcriptional regulator MalT